MLEYYEKDSLKNQKGSINLEDCSSMITRYSQNPFRFALETPKRIYFLDADNQGDFDEWTSFICKAGGFPTAQEAASGTAGAELEGKTKLL